LFRHACKIARGFTWPIVISRRMVSGRCSAVIGSCIVVNPQGWIVTAGHVLKECDKVANAGDQTHALRAEIAAIQEDTTIESSERVARIATVKAPKPDDTLSSSVWFGKDGVRMKEGYWMEAADLGLARLEPFDPAWVPHYPVFKDPKTDFEPGTSLCRLGFPFYSLEPTWDAGTGAFRLPPEAVPLPFFPVEGIFTRMADIRLPSGAKVPVVVPPYPLRLIETSSPGLRGQSGGPIFDTDGRIWGVQSATTSYSLDLNTNYPQYLNVGLGVSPITIFGFFDEFRINYHVSPPNLTGELYV